MSLYSLIFNTELIKNNQLEFITQFCEQFSNNKYVARGFLDMFGTVCTNNDIMLIECMLKHSMMKKIESDDYQRVVCLMGKFIKANNIDIVKLFIGLFLEIGRITEYKNRYEVKHLIYCGLEYSKGNASMAKLFLWEWDNGKTRYTDYYSVKSSYEQLMDTFKDPNDLAKFKEYYELLRKKT